MSDSNNMTPIDDVLASTSAASLAGPVHLESNYGGFTVYICNHCGSLVAAALRAQHTPCPTIEPDEDN